MKKEDIERRLQEGGYEYNLKGDQWRLTLEDEMVGIPGIGEGHYKKTHDVSVTDSSVIQSLYDHFSITDVILILREINPFPFDGWTYVKVTYLGEEPRNHFTECNFDYIPGQKTTPKNWLNGTNLQIGVPGVYSAHYKGNGDLAFLNAHFGDGPFVSFDFSNGNIVDSDDEPLGRLPDYLNTNRRLLFDERHYSITQSKTETTARVTQPAINQDLAVIAVPPRVSIVNIGAVLTGDGKDWLQLLEHIPAKVDMPRGLPK